MRRALLPLALLFITVPSLALAQGAPILKKLDALKRPKYEAAKENDKKYMDQYMADIALYAKKRNALVWELLKKDPKNPRRLSLLEDRWNTFEMGNLGDGSQYVKRVYADMDRVLSLKLGPEVEELAAAKRLQVKSEFDYANGVKLADFERFRARFPKGKQAERLLVDLYFASRDEKSEFAKRYLSLYPEGHTPPRSSALPAKRRRWDSPLTWSSTTRLPVSPSMFRR